MFITRGLLLAAAMPVAMALSVLPSQAQTAKTPIRGLVSMGAYKFVSAGGEPINTLDPLNAKPGIFGGLVVVATWNQLQPTPKSQIGDGNAIDQALALVRTYNQQNPQKPLAVKLRVWGGFEAPDWAKSIGGPPIATTFNGNPRTVGRFWSPAYRRAWARLQQQLAARYDAEPLIHEVSVTSCMSYTAEPFFVPTDATVMTPLVAAGFTANAYKHCLTHAVGDYAPWQTSRLVLAVNPFRSALGQGNGDPGFTKRVMQNCRTVVGVRCVFDNHDLNSPLTTSLVPIYREMRRLGPEIEFQTFNETPAAFSKTIALGVRYGASSIELYQDFKGFPLVPDDTLRRWAAMIEQNTGDPLP